MGRRKTLIPGVVLGILLLVAAVYAAHTFTIEVAQPAENTWLNGSIDYVFNFTLKNAASSDTNITEINITFPSQYTLINYSISNTTFSCTNVTSGVINCLTNLPPGNDTLININATTQDNIEGTNLCFHFNTTSSSNFQTKTACHDLDGIAPNSTTPTITPLYSGSVNYTNATPYLNWTVHDGGKGGYGCAYSANNGTSWASGGILGASGQAIVNCTASVSTQGDGTMINITVMGNDTFHWSNQTATLTNLTVDAGVPSVTINPALSGWYSGNLEVKFTATDTRSGVDPTSPKVHNTTGWMTAPSTGLANEYSATIDTSKLTDGSGKAINASANDNVTNFAQDSDTINIDNNPPNISAITLNVSTETTLNASIFVNTTFQDGSGIGVNANNCTLEVTGATTIAPSIMNTSGGTSNQTNSTIFNLTTGNSTIWVNCTDGMGQVGSNNITVKIQTLGTLEIVSLTGNQSTVSRGQTASVSMVVNNTGEANVNLTYANVTFNASGMDTTSNYTISLDGNPLPIVFASGTTTTLNFTVVVASGAMNNLTTIDGNVSGTDADTAVATSDEDATTKATWTVQTPASLTIQTIATTTNTARRESTYAVYFTVNNTGEASANITYANVTFVNFSLADFTTNFTISYPTGQSVPIVVQGGTVARINFSVQVKANAILGNRTINATITAYDTNSWSDVSDNDGPNQNTSWVVALKLTGGSPGGGGGGGGGGASTGGGGGGACSQYKFIQEIPAGTSKTVTYTKACLGVGNIKIAAINEVENVKVTITKRDGRGTIPTDASGTVYRYFMVSSENIKEEDIEEAVITFKVEKTWIENQSIIVNSLAMYRYTDKWNKLETNKEYEIGGNITFTAKTPGFSTFAVTGDKKKTAEKVEGEAEEEINETKVLLDYGDVYQQLMDLQSQVEGLKLEGYDTAEAENYLNQAMEKIDSANSSISTGDYAAAAGMIDEANALVPVVKAAMLKKAPPTGAGILVWLKDNALTVFVPLIAVLLVGGAFVLKGKGTKEIKSKMAELEKKLEELKKRAKATETEYFQTKIDKTMYKKMMADIESEKIACLTQKSKLEDKLKEKRGRHKSKMTIKEKWKEFKKMFELKRKR